MGNVVLPLILTILWFMLFVWDLINIIKKDPNPLWKSLAIAHAIIVLQFIEDVIVKI